MDPQLDPPHVDARIAELAERQHGVVDTEQLVGLGLTRPAIESRKRRGSLHPVHRGVYAVGHRRLSYDGRCVAALRAYGSRAVLSHVTAAARWDLRRSSSRRIHVSVAGRAGVIERDGTVLHRPRSIYASEVDTVDGMRVTSVARTLLDLSGMLARGPLERAVERSLFLQLFDLDAVVSVMGRHRGCRGIATLRAILADLHDEPQLTRSDLEGFFIDLCDTNGLPRPEVKSMWCTAASMGQLKAAARPRVWRSPERRPTVTSPGVHRLR